VFTFLKQTFRNYRHVGAVAPSSRALAHALAAPLTQRDTGPIQVLEAGPGTGALTLGIVRMLRPGDHLTLCEINHDFVCFLKNRFDTDPELVPWRESVTIHHGPVEDLGDSRRFHHIVCGLPFNNFDPDLVRRIFSGFQAVLLPGGTVNFFEYVAIRAIKMPFAGKTERMRLREVASVIGELIRDHQVSRRTVIANLPPAWARSLKF
jgi:phospholipid N-methyltransferase